MQKSDVDSLNKFNKTSECVQAVCSSSYMRRVYQDKRVRKETFLNTLCISNKTVQYYFEKKKKDLSHHDRRLKRPSSNKASDAVITQIRNHILSFPLMESHSCQQSTSRQYLHANLNFKKLHEAYEKKMKLKKHNRQPSAEKSTMQN